MADDETALDPEAKAQFDRLHRLNADLAQLDKNKFIVQRSMELSTPPAVTLNPNGTIIAVNLGMEALLGHAENDLVGKSLMSIMPPRFHAEYKAGFARYLQTGEPDPEWKESLQFPALRKDGAETTVSIKYTEFAQNGDRYVVVSMRVIDSGGN